MKDKFEKFYNNTNIQMLCHTFRNKVYQQLKPLRTIKKNDACGRPE